MSPDTVLVASTVAYSLFVIDTIYSYVMYVLKRSKRYEQRLINSFAIFIIVAPLLAINIVDLITSLLGLHPLLFSLDLLYDFAVKAQQAADRAIDAALKMSVILANSQVIVQTATIIASIFFGIAAMVIGTAINTGIGLIKGEADVVLRIAQVLYAVGSLYKVMYEVGKYARLITPLGLALLVSKKSRPIGAIIVAFGIGFGYIMPFALNSIAYKVQGVTISLENTTGVPSVMCIHVVSGAPLVNGSVVTAGFPAVVVYKDLDRPNRTVVHPVGCYSELTGHYRVTEVIVGAEPIEVNYTFTVNPLPSNITTPFNSYDDMYLQKIAYPDLARLAELAGNNFTLVLNHGPLPGGEKYYVAFWEPYSGHYAYIATDAFKLAPMNISTPWYTRTGVVYDSYASVWYNYTYFPLLKPVMFADTWNDAKKSFTYTKNMTIVKDGQNYTVTVNCTVTSSMAYGSVEKVEVVDYGETEVNGTTLKPQVDIDMRSHYHWDPEAWRNFTRDTFNVWFNQSTRIFNNTIIDRNNVRVTLEKQNNTIKKMTVEKTVLGIGIPQMTFENPHFSWSIAPGAPQVVVTTTYCGRVVKPARVKLYVSEIQFASYPVKPETILMLNYDPIAEPFASDTPLTLDFKEEAKNFLWGVYPFIFMLGIIYALGFFAINALSGFLGGPSIGQRYLFGKFQQPYWDLVVSRLGDVVLLLAGRGIPSVPNFSAKYEPLITRMNQQLKQIRQQMPLAVAGRKVKEAFKSKVTIYNLEEAEKRLYSVASGIKSALINKTLAALNLQIVERPVLKSGDKPLVIERVIIKRTEKIRTALVSPDQKLSDVKMYKKVPVDPMTAKPIKVLYVGPPKLPPIERQLITTSLYNLALAINEATYNRTSLFLVRLFVGTLYDAVMSRNSHTIDAILSAAAHRLRTEAAKISERTGTHKTFHPVSNMLLKTANYLDMVRLLQNHYKIYSHTMFMLAVNMAYRPEKLSLSTKFTNTWLQFNTEKAYLATIIELAHTGHLDRKYGERAEALYPTYLEIYKKIIEAPAKTPELLKQYKDTIEEARRLIHEVVGSELAKEKVSTRLVNEIAELKRLGDLYLESLGTPSEKSSFEAYKRFAEKIISELRSTDSELLKRYADFLEQDILFIQDLYNEEKMQEFYKLADAYTRAMGTAIGQVAKVLGEHDPRFREIYTKHSGDPLQLSIAFDKLLEQLEVTDPGITEPIKDFKDKLQEYIYLKVTGADKKELEEAKEGILLAYQAALIALGLRAELYKFDMEPVDRAADAFGDALANFFNQVALMMQLAEAKTPEEAQRIREEIAGFKATALVDLAIERLMSREELEEEAKSLPEHAQLFIKGAISALSGEDYEALGSDDERMGYIYVKTKTSPEALSELRIPVRDWDSFLTGMQDAISAMANKEAPSMEEAKAKALEQPEYRDYWAGMYFAELLVYQGIDEAKLKMAELYGAEEKKREAIISEEIQKKAINEAQIETRLGSINDAVDEITKKLDDLATNLASQGIEPGLSVAMSLASKEAVEDALETLYDLLAQTKKEITALNAMRPSLEYASEDLKDHANRLYNQLLSLEDNIKESITNLRSILSSMEEQQ
jgi:hypothetical protein